MRLWPFRIEGMIEHLVHRLRPEPEAVDTTIRFQTRELDTRKNPVFFEGRTC